MSRCLTALLIALLIAPASALAKDHTLSDPLAEANEASYLVIAPAALADAVEPLLDYRAKKGLSTGFLSVEAIESAMPAREKKRPRQETIRSLLSAALTNWATPPRYLLLVGDTDSIPHFKVDKVPSDHRYAAPRREKKLEIAVGRFPARTESGVRRMVEKTIALEERAAGAWQRELQIFAGVGGFKFDPIMEAIATRMLSKGVPGDYDLHVTYASPESPYFYPPRHMASSFAKGVSDGPLFVTFIGHGSRSGTQNARYAGESFPILDAGTARRLKDAEATGLIVLACWTGAYQGDKDSIGETLMKHPSGVAWFLGSTLESAPYGNGVLGDALIAAALKPGGAGTVGEVVLEAKRSLLASPLLRGMGWVSAKITGVSTSGDEVWEHVLLYNLFGDPAAPMRRPESALRLALVGGEQTFHVEGQGAPAGSTVRVSLETERPVVRGPLQRFGPRDEGWMDKVVANHERANDKVLTVIETTATTEGTFSVTLPRP
ncbi:MAG: C25 family cysteine peptidase, partial [Planctomycetota bacterium]